EGVRRIPWGTSGYSGSMHERWEVERRGGERIHLILKRTRPAQDWTAYRTGDHVGREAILLGTPELTGVWNVFQCPYRAYAIQDGEIALLMDDLSEHLFPDEDAPIAVLHEDIVLDTLAGLHAKYWNSEVLGLPWLVASAKFFGVLGPRAADEEALRPQSFALFDTVREGWRSAFARLPTAIGGLLGRPAEVLANRCKGLPRTLLHGDAKISNFAVLPGGKCAAFDWALIGVGPATLDLGWYLAVNSGRLARPKEAVIAHYRSLLESKVGAALSPEVWGQMLSVGVLCGALMLLWSKALALESGSEGSAKEWDWWVGQLHRQVRTQ
ncbi:MAG TPA: phosphotransferase, partial [Dehalococcoidia bacterium]|nr:phosphotransferase [Dehalococcoidia bacterium]